jgi:hypothetical protein
VIGLLVSRFWDNREVFQLDALKLVQRVIALMTLPRQSSFAIVFLFD